ncbi:MAG TPA: metal-dependent hydrolase [Bacteroidia bacterium]|nr:metal-dependent hydrolase [Bacteroidia bacterium]HNT80598.1 metal-dependent hydrolase [Bacteroidia bacterium]
MEITYYGHSCFAVKVSGKTLLFDPFISPNSLATHIDLKKIKADYVLISHGHEDHIADAVSLIKQSNATAISSYEIAVWLQKQGVEKVHSMNIGGHWIFEFGKVKCVVAVHSSMLPDGSYGGNPMGFLVESPEGNFYYAGDTALTLDMQLIGEYKKIDFAFLPLGNNYTMGVDNAIIASGFIKCNNIIGMHYDTFDLIRIDHNEAIEKFTASGRTLHLIPIGETIQL